MFDLELVFDLLLVRTFERNGAQTGSGNGSCVKVFAIPVLGRYSSSASIATAPLSQIPDVSSISKVDGITH